LGLFQQYAETLSSLDSNIERYLVIGGAEIHRNVEQETIALNQVAAEIALSAADNLADPVTQLQRATQDLVADTLELVNTEGVDSRQRNEQIRGTYDAVEYAHSTLQQSVQATLTQLQTTIDAQENIVTTVLSQQIMLAIVVTVADSIGSVLIARTIVNPLTHIAEITADIARGNYSQQVNIHSRDEIGQLSQSVNKMASAVQDRQAELAEFNRTLEQRVTERTEELRQSRDEALAARRLAQENSRLKSEFLSTMSHELRTPMNAIEGFTSIMLSRMGGVEFNEKAERYITRVNVNSKRLLQLINDFLDLSRVESGRLELAHQPFSPADLARRWQMEIGILAEKKNIGFELTLDPRLPETVYGDEEAISKVALNLLSNAIKFTEQGKVSLSLANGGDNWRIIVADSGIGIPPHAREYIFEEFRQVDQTSKRKYGGTGLGLAIVQKYARTMGGNVSLQSEVGTGSAFTVTLPLESQFESMEREA
jgi:signal transduction histidine kinase